MQRRPSCSSAISLSGASMPKPMSVSPNRRSRASRTARFSAAGVSGYGTDQEYLLLKKLWPQVKPAVVVLIFGTDNDRLDNSRSRRASPR